MYRAHSKDINRNKSFHPLTYGNLRRVEILKEGEDEKKQRAAERQKELQRDQEERRYDELVLANSADSLSGELARFRQTKNIFKAEYDAEAIKKQHEVKSEGATSGTSNGSSAAPSSSASASPFASSSNAFLSKFKKSSDASSDPVHSSATTAKSEVKPELSEGDSATSPDASNSAHRKRAREEENENGQNMSIDASGSGVKTGFVTSAEAAQLRKELNLAQKQRHDPLMRVRQFQNSCVASAARQQQQQQQQQQRNYADGASGHDLKGRAASGAKDNSDALQSRIRELLALKKKK